MTVYLNNYKQDPRQHAQNVMNLIEFTSLINITSEASIYFDPDDMATLIKVDEPLLDEYKEFNKMN